MTIATAVARSPIASETRPATSVRVRRSRPLASVPKRKRRRSIGASIESRLPSSARSRTCAGPNRSERSKKASSRSSIGRGATRVRRRASPSMPGIFGAGADARRNALRRRHDLLGLRVRRHARRDADIVLVDAIVGVPRRERAEKAGERDQGQHGHARDGGAVARQARPRVGPERAAGDLLHDRQDGRLTHSAPADR